MKFKNQKDRLIANPFDNSVHRLRHAASVGNKFGGTIYYDDPADKVVVEIARTLSPEQLMIKEGRHYISPRHLDMTR
jgi:hypothetical protein